MGTREIGILAVFSMIGSELYIKSVSRRCQWMHGRMYAG